MDSDLCVKEELLGTTMGKDMFEALCGYVNEMRMPWDKLVALTTDGSPRDVRSKEKMRENA